MSTGPLVSIVVPFWNGERFLEEAVLSVLAQTYESWELFLVDDGSTDESTTIARGYAERDARICYLGHRENRGKSFSRDRGVQNASGKYVAFLDADDVWLPCILEEQVSILESHPEAAMVYGPIEWWYSWTGHSEDLGRDYVEELGVPANTVIEPPHLLALFLQDRAAVPSDILVRRETIERVGSFEENFKVLYEDQVFYAKICLAAPVFASDTCWYRYRQHPDSSCAKAIMTGEYYTTRSVFLNWLAVYVSDQYVDDMRLWQALYEELWPYRHPAACRLVKRFPARYDIVERVAQFERGLHRLRRRLGR